jgi:AraC-like DNA-binding protein
MLSSVYRPSPRPRARIPLGARSVGHYVAEPGWKDREKRKYFTQVFWGVEGQGRFIMGGRPVFLRPNHVLCYFPGDVHRVEAVDETWEYRWWTVDGPASVEIVKGFGLAEAEPIPAGPPPVALFEALAREIQEADPTAEIRAGITSYRLLAHAAGHEQRRIESAEPALADRCMRLIEERYADADLCVKEMADSLGVDRSHLSRAVRARAGVPPSEYLQRVRLQKAFALLRSSDRSIKQIAQEAGFTNPAYFSRLVAASTGMPPSVCRQRWQEAERATGDSFVQANGNSFS